jgi:hypothetical protein
MPASLPQAPASSTANPYTNGIITPTTSEICAGSSDPTPEDIDGDGYGNTCDPDDDQDGVCDAAGPLPPGTPGTPTGCLEGPGGVDACPTDRDCDDDSNSPPGYTTCLGACPGGYWRDGVEVAAGTSPTDRCADTTASGDEPDDKWPPDYDDNRAVNVVDFTLWKAGYASPPKPLIPRSDLDASGTVNVLDFGAWKAYFGKTCLP